MKSPGSKLNLKVALHTLLQRSSISRPGPVPGCSQVRIGLQNWWASMHMLVYVHEDAFVKVVHTHVKLFPLPPPIAASTGTLSRKGWGLLLYCKRLFLYVHDNFIIKLVFGTNQMNKVSYLPAFSLAAASESYAQVIISLQRNCEK